MTSDQLRGQVGYQLLGHVEAILNSVPPAVLPAHSNLAGKIVGMLLDDWDAQGFTPANVKEAATPNRTFLLARVEEALRILREHQRASAAHPVGAAAQGEGVGLRDADMEGAE
jgi:hypothetical protein